LCLRNYQIGFDFIFLSVINIILKLHIEPIIKLKHAIYLFIHININHLDLFQVVISKIFFLRFVEGEKYNLKIQKEEISWTLHFKVYLDKRFKKILYKFSSTSNDIWAHTPTTMMARGTHVPSLFPHLQKL
jgi:hypothetical protein